MNMCAYEAAAGEGIPAVLKNLTQLPMKTIHFEVKKIHFRIFSTNKQFYYILNNIYLR